MLATNAQSATSNRILAALSPSDFGLLSPHLVSLDLPIRMRLEPPKKRIEHVYFIERGIASVVANGAGTRCIEVGLIGPEGMTGFAVIMGGARSPNETYVQLAGAGLRIPAEVLCAAFTSSRTLHAALLRYGLDFANQTTQTALANGRSKIEERLARWLLMAHDRVMGDELPLTHEFLATMLGVRRPGVALTLSLLQNAGLIRTGRGVVSIVDRVGLEEASNGAYGASEAELGRLFKQE
jgi:CRP-like cAMP-binding protein